MNEKFSLARFGKTRDGADYNVTKWGGLLKYFNAIK